MLKSLRVCKKENLSHTHFSSLVAKKKKNLKSTKKLLLLFKEDLFSQKYSIWKDVIQNLFLEKTILGKNN